MPPDGVTDLAPHREDAERAFRRALTAERLRNARLFNLLRFIGVSAFLALALFAAFVLGDPDWRRNNWTLFAAYWAAAGGMFWFGGRSEAVARVAALGIPLLDMPAVFLLQWSVLAHVPNAESVARATAGLLVLLLIGAMAALDERELVLAAVVAVVLQAALEYRADVDFAAALTSVLVIALAAVGAAYVLRRTTHLVEDVSAEQLRRERLGRYFSPQVAAMLAAAPEGMGGGTSCEVTVLFTDLRDFTARAERLGGSEVVDLLNDCHRRTVDTLFAFGGTLDKYLGDGLMAYFGAPVVQADHAERAVRCALAMQEKLAGLNAERRSRGEDALHMGIGIHTGTVVLGDIGAPQRREFTIIGDAVNVAARLQELTKERRVGILVSASTRARVSDTLVFTSVGPVEIRGRAQALDAYVPAPTGAGR
jgi:adenylate cyclase